MVERPTASNASKRIGLYLCQTSNIKSATRTERRSEPHKLLTFNQSNAFTQPSTIFLRVLEKTGLRYAEEVSFWGHQFSKYIIIG
jgi:hypothetical protein